MDIITSVITQVKWSLDYGLAHFASRLTNVAVSRDAALPVRGAGAIHSNP